MNLFEKIGISIAKSIPFVGNILAGNAFIEQGKNQNQKQLAGTTRWTNRFFDGYDGLNDKEKEQWRKEHEEYENTVSRKHPEATELQRNMWRNNKFKQEIIKNLKTKEGKELQSMLFDEKGKAKNEGAWQNIDSFMATLAQNVDFDGISDKKEQWYKQSKFEKFLHGAEGVANSMETTFREAAIKHLDDTKENADNLAAKQSILEQMLSDEIDGERKTKSERIKDFDKLAEDVSQDYEILMNPEKYKLLQGYKRLKDVEELALKPEEKLDLYAQYKVDAQRGGESYAKKKLQDYFVNRMAQNQSVLEMIMNTAIRFQDDVQATQIGILGMIDGLTNRNITKMLGVTGTEEDQKRREGQSYIQNIFDNPWVQYANNLQETHVYGVEAQKEMLKHHLNNAELYETTAEQQSVLPSIASMMGLLGDYGFTAGMTLGGGLLSKASKIVPAGAKLFGKLATGTKDVEGMNKALKAGIRGRDIVNFFNACLVGGSEGAMVTLSDKVDNYNDGLQGLQSEFAKKMVQTNPTDAVAILRNAGVTDGLPSGSFAVTKEGMGVNVYNPDEIQQILKLIEDNPELQQQLAGAYEASNPEEVAMRHEELKDVVETSAATEFIFQQLINGALNTTLKKTLQAPGIQRSMARVKARFGGKTSKLDDQVDLFFDEATKTWKAKAKDVSKYALVKERLKESAGEMAEEYFQSVGTGLGEGFYKAAYEDFIDSRFGDKDHVNTAMDMEWGNALLGALQGMGEAAVSDDAIMSGIYGGLSSGIGGFNFRQNVGKARNRSNDKPKSKFNKVSDFVDKWSPVSWRGAWTPLINKTDVSERQAANDRLAKSLNNFFSDKEIQEKLNTAHGAVTFLNEYNKAIEAGKEFQARNARYGSIFSIANMLSKLDGTAFHTAMTQSLDIREKFDELTDEQIKEALASEENNDIKKALIEFKTEPSNRTGDAEQYTVTDSQENVDTVRQIAQNAKQMKECLKDIGETRKQVEKNFGGIDSDAIDALVYQELAIKNKRERRNSIEDEFQQAVSFDSAKQEDNDANKAITKYGSLETIQKERQELEQTRDGLLEQVRKNEDAYKALLQKQEDHRTAVKENDGKESEETKKKALTEDERKQLSDYNDALRNLARLNSDLRTIQKEEDALEKAVNKTVSRASDSAETTKSNPVLSERDIMEMDAASRAFMLSEQNKLKKDGTNRYSAEQQAVIDRLNEKGRETVKDWDRKIQDAANLQQALTIDVHAQNEIMRNSQRLSEFVRNAKMTKLERDKTYRWEPLFTDAEKAINEYNENNPETVQARAEALRALAEFMNGEIENGDAIDAIVRMKLQHKYGDSRALQTLRKNEQEMKEFAKTMDTTDAVPYTTAQQADDSSVNAYMQSTEEHKMSNEDSTLLSYALTYATNHGMTLDDIPDIVKTEDFQNFVRDTNQQFAKQGKDTKATVVTPDNAELYSNVFRGAINYHRAITQMKQEKEAKRQEEMEKIQPAKSVTPEPVHIEPKEEEKPKTEQPKQEGVYDYDSELLSEEIQKLSKVMQLELKKLLDDVKTMTSLYGNPINQKDKNEILKKIIELAKSKEYKNVRELQNDLRNEYGTKRKDNPLKLLADAVSTITSPTIQIEDQQEEKKEEQPEKKVVPLELESQPLEFFMSHPGSATANFITSHKMTENFIRARDEQARRRKQVADKKRQNDFLLKAAFLFIPTLADAVEDSMKKQGYAYDEKIHAPIVMAIPVTIEEAKSILGTDAISERIIDVETNNFNYPAEKGIVYLPIGIMPSTNNENIDSSSNMAGIRELIDTGIDYSADTDTEKNAENLPRVLRYRAVDKEGKQKVYEDKYPFAKGKPKENGTIISFTVDFKGNTKEEVPSGASTVERSSVITLGDQNINDKGHELVPNIGDKDRAEYEDAKAKGPKALRSNSVYTAIRSAFIRLLDKQEKTKTAPAKLVYLLNKDSKNVYPKAVHIRPVSQTHHRDDPNTLITNILRRFSNTNDNSKEIIGSGNYGDKGANSKLSSLFYALQKLLNEKTDDGKSNIWPERFFGDDGAIKERYDKKGGEYDKYVSELAKDILDVISSRLSIRQEGASATIKVDIDKNKPLSEKTMTISVMMGNNALASITLTYGEQFEGKHFMSFLKELILEDPEATDEKGNPKVRMNGKDEVVKWNVNYQDAVTANKTLSNKDTAKMSQEDIAAFNKRKERAQHALEDAYDDDIFTLRLDRLSYIPNSAVVAINTDTAKQQILKTGTPDKKNEGATGKPSDTSKSGDGSDIQSNSGIVEKKPAAPAEDGNETLQEKISKQIDRIIESSRNRTVTPDEKWYRIGRYLHARVTTVKSFLKGGRLEPFDKNSPWKLPSTSIGNSFDEFARDVFNGIYDGISEEELRKLFEERYSNATVDHYMNAYNWISSWKAKMIGNGYQIVDTLRLEDGQGIVAQGTLKISLKYGTTKFLRTAGTVDLLLVGPDGKYHIYDFKTYHDNEKFTADVAVKKGYDRQLSMYAEFLQREYGIVVDTINIIPCHVDYDTPGGLTQYRKKDQDPASMSNQLEISQDGGKTWHDVKGANFNITSEDPIPLTRLSGERLEASYENMTDEELDAIAEALSDQEGETVRPEDIGKPVNKEEPAAEEPIVEVKPDESPATADDNMPTDDEIEAKIKEAEAALENKEDKVEPKIEEKPVAEEKKTPARRIVRGNSTDELAKKQTRRKRTGPSKPVPHSKVIESIVQQDKFEQSEKDKHKQDCNKR